PYTIFENTYKLKPGHILNLDFAEQSLDITQYWNVETFYRLPKLEMPYEDAKENVHQLLRTASTYRMVADVPVGVFLSGGYDSTAVTAILQKDNTEKIKTFTIGFEEGNNEAPFAKETAEYLGTDHTEFICTAKEAQKIIPDLPYFFDEPFADSSAIPTILVSRLARQQVTVALSADAGDEVFAGYTRYADLGKKLYQLNRLPDTIKPVASMVTALASRMVSNKRPELKHKLHGVSKAIQSDRLKQSSVLFQLMNSLPKSYRQDLFLSRKPDYSTGYSIDTSGFHHELEIAMAVDYQLYLQNDILTKVDRATMSVSLEGREPLLDQRLVEFAAQLPFEYKYDGKTAKRILKDIVHEYIPKKMMDRPKSGFSLPIYVWLRGDLSYLFDEYLNEKAIGISGLFDTKFVMEQVRKFKNGSLHYDPFIWKMLMFQMWYKRWM
ncbi:MAG: asparagine synthase C-terminal domain-containing protein, partial [Ferruginibacter sp.]